MSLFSNMSAHQEKQIMQMLNGEITEYSDEEVEETPEVVIEEVKECVQETPEVVIEEVEECVQETPEVVIEEFEEEINTPVYSDPIMLAISVKKSSLARQFNERIQPIRLHCMKLYIAEHGAYNTQNHAECAASFYYSNLIDQFDAYMNRSKNGLIPVVYVKPKHGWGRVGPQRSQGLTAFSRHVRNALIADDYYDFDLKNCQPEIILNLCRTNNIPCSEIAEYCENRDKIFNELSVNYGVPAKSIKKLFLRLCFFGTFSGWCNEINKPDLIEHKTITRFVSNLQSIAEVIRKENPKLYETARKKQSSEGKKNYIGSMFALYVQEYELRIIEAVSNHLIYDTKIIKNNEYTYEYDGLKLPRGPVDDAGGPKVVLAIMNKCLKSNRWVMKFEEKPLESNIDLSPYVDEATIALKNHVSLLYEDVKERFEVDCFKIITPGMYALKLDDKIQIRTESEMFKSFGHMTCTKIVDGKLITMQFINTWVKDNDIRRYENVGTYPYPKVCPHNHYNEWKDFRAENLLMNTYDESAVAAFIEHIDILCGKEDRIREYFLDWIAHMFQMPGQKPEIMPIFVSEEGGGKGSLVYLLQRLIGAERVCDSTNADSFVGHFNEGLDGSFLIVLDELAKSQIGHNSGALKELLTKPTLKLNKKGQSHRMIDSNHRVMATTNKENAGVTLTTQSRRWYVIRCADELIGNAGHFTELYKLMDNDNAIASFYKYLMARPNAADFTHIKQPLTRFHKELAQMNESVVHQFLRDYVGHDTYTDEDGEVIEGNSEGIDVKLSAKGDRKIAKIKNITLYKEFITWRDARGFRYETNSNSLMTELINSKIGGIESGANGKPKIFKLQVIRDYFSAPLKLSAHSDCS